MGVTFDAVQDKKRELIRKTTDMSAFIAPDTADPISTLTDTDMGLLALPAGYADLGLLSTDGIQFAREIERSDIRSAGRVEATRSDITTDSTTAEIACQETKLTTIGLYTGADMTGVTPDATSGEVGISKPARPTIRNYRLLGLGVDTTDDGEIYIARFLPQAQVTEVGDQPWQSEEDEALLWSVTMQGFLDSTLGYSERWMFGGPGWDALLTQMGW